MRCRIHNRSTALSTGTQWQTKRWKSRAQAIRPASTSTSSASKPRHGVPQSSSKPKPTKPAAAKTIAPSQIHTASASSVAVKRTASVPGATTDALTSEGDKLNPPSFTYAPALSIPDRKDGQNYASYLFSCGKAYLSFYKTGIGHTRQTLKFARAIRARLADQGRGINDDIAGAGILSRSEWQVLRRSKRDLLRLPVMGFLVLALGEWLPLVVVYLTPVIPEQCRIPAQVERVLKKKESTRRDRLQRIATHALRLQSLDRTPRTDQDGIRLAAAAEGVLDPRSKAGKQGGMAMAHAIIPPEASNDLSLFHLLLLSARLDCHPRILDKLWIRPPKWLLQRNVSNTLAYLTKDDELIRRDGGSQRLHRTELSRACVERGIDVLGKSEAEQRKGLAQWYDT
ncbi:hypothetical protein E8E12_011463 [Didymella heteroderae]|uniref:Letm1 RBD domain-containing protein n=1 Tax=Didymella heteroderae TaxID=1769908 RepID=A0A9P4X253_9PLEO|nr:hypothetical protein E8E12_011463 [Didymella heteroderae]